MPNLCAACSLPILDQFLSKVLNKTWHNECVRCSECQKPLSDKCFSKNGNIYCKEDFDRLFGIRCSGCDCILNANDLVQRINDSVYHNACLTCSQCGRQLNAGEQLFKTESNKFLCKDDHEDARKRTFSDSSPISDESEDKNTTSNGSDDEDGTNGKRRGPRTTIKAKQLETLKSAFATTPKPSRHIREKLAQETGLNMRVIQVWFQNRRSKERRMKQLSVLGGRRTTSRGSKQESRQERESLDGSSPESISTAFHFFPQVNPSQLVPSATEDYNGNGISFPVGIMARNFLDQSMMKSEFGAMEMAHTGTFSFVESLGSEASVAVPHFNPSQPILSSAQLPTTADVW